MDTFSVLSVWLGVWTCLGGTFSFLGTREGAQTHYEATISDLSSSGIRLFLQLEAVDQMVFGKKYLSFRSLAVSSLITTLAYAACLTILFVANGADTAFNIFTIKVWLMAYDDKRVDFLLVLMLTAILFDYASIVQTRILLSRLARARHIWMISILVPLDFVLTTIIAIIQLAMFFFAPLLVAVFLLKFADNREAAASITATLSSIMEFLQAASNGEASFRSGTPLVPIAFMFLGFPISYLTSLWIWIYSFGWIVGSVSIRAERAKRIGKFLQPAARACYLIGIIGAAVLFVA